MSKIKIENKSRFALILSILIHLLFILSSNLIPLPEKNEKPIEIEVIEQKNPAAVIQQHVVRNHDIPLDKIINSTKKTEMLSEKTVRVREQTRAHKSGLTQNRNGGATSLRRKVAKYLPQLNGEGAFSKPYLNRNSGASTISDDLSKDIKIGDVTALDTDQYLYYSFISRAGESFYYEWEPMIQGLLENPPVLLKSKGPGRYTTILEVWFLPDGKIHSLHILKPSGIPEFDFAATRSFKAIAMVPNPPKQKLDSDGLIRFTWQLTVHHEPKALVRQ